MITSRLPRAEAARPNASTGPRSAEGKARSSMNALKSGIYSKSETIPGEDPAQLTALTQEYFERYRPDLPEQREQVDVLVRSTWTLRRLAAAEAQVWIYQLDTAYKLNSEAPLGHAFHTCDRTLSRLQRMVNSTQRNYRDALHELERLQAQPPAAPPPAPAPQPAETKPANSSKEFVSSSSAPPPSGAPKSAPNAPSKKLPFHLPGSQCSFSPIDQRKYKRCPSCFPADCDPDAQE
jgi:hypothetical protein